MTRTMSAAMLALLVSGSVVACGDEGPPNPAGVKTPDIPEAVEPGEVVRRVETRNPMASRVGNLLVDGDFELSVVIQGTGPQSGWLAFGGTGYLRGETGGLCRSGLRCGWIDPGVSLFGQGAAAKGAGMIASVYAKPPVGFGCGALSAQVLKCNFYTTAAAMFPQSEEPDPDGWCYYRGRVAEQETGTCMFLESVVISDPILVDDAAIVPDTGTTPLSSAQGIPESKFRPLRGEQRERVRALVKWRRDRMKIGAPLQEQPTIGLE